MKNLDISADDRVEIQRAIDAVPSIHRILSQILRIYTDRDGRILVATGTQRGPRDGGGYKFQAERSGDGQWSVKKIGTWKS